jgi:cell wall assembly regulator SMI1
MSMKRTWKRIEAWLTDNAPAILSDLRPGASTADIRWAEAQLGCMFPKAVKDSYLIHNGTEGCALMEYWEFYSLAEAVEAWKSLKSIYDRGIFDAFFSKPVGPIRTQWWHPLWIPLTGEPGGNHLCLDLAPLRGGHKGQVISWVHDDSVREIVAPTIGGWLKQFADALEAGIYKVDREGVLVRIGGPEDMDNA